MDTQNKNMIADIRSEQIDTFEETNTLEDGTVETATYKFFNVNGVFGKILDKLSYVRTHAAATWYNKLAGVTVKDKIDALNSNIVSCIDIILPISIPANNYTRGYEIDDYIPEGHIPIAFVPTNNIPTSGYTITYYDGYWLIVHNLNSYAIEQDLLGVLFTIQK